MPKQSGPPRDHEAIRDVAERIYRLKIGERGIRNHIRELGDVEGNAKIRRLAASYDNTAVCAMKALGIPVPTLERAENEPLQGLFGD
jgi:hypothetical protein